LITIGLPLALLEPLEAVRQRRPLASFAGHLPHEERERLEVPRDPQPKTRKRTSLFTVPKAETTRTHT
jgi:hypothetical protein